MRCDSNEAKLGKNIRLYYCHSSRNGKIFMLVALAFIFIIPIVPNIYYLGFQSLEIKDFVSAVSGLLSLIYAIVIFMKQRNCFIAVNENGIYGLKPAFPCRAKYFDIYYDDIIKTNDLIMPISKIPPFVYIKTTSKRYFFACLEKDEFDFLISYARSKIAMGKKQKG